MTFKVFLRILAPVFENSKKRMFDFIKKVLLGQENDPKTANPNTSITTETEPEMVYLIVGLGNIGNEYALRAIM